MKLVAVKYFEDLMYCIVYCFYIHLIDITNIHHKYDVFISVLPFTVNGFDTLFMPSAFNVLSCCKSYLKYSKMF